LNVKVEEENGDDCGESLNESDVFPRVGAVAEQILGVVNGHDEKLRLKQKAVSTLFFNAKCVRVWLNHHS